MIAGGSLPPTDTSQGRPRSRLWSAAFLAILAVGAGLRLRSVSATSSLVELREMSRSDHLEYFDLGQNLHDFRVLGWRSEPSAFRGVLFPAFLSVAERFGSSDWARAPMIEAVLSSLEIPLAGWLALELHSPGAALVSGAFVAFHPALRDLATPYQIDDFYGLLLMLVAVALTAWTRSPTAGRSWLLGFTISTSLLCRSVLFIFPPCLALVRPRRGPWRRALWVVLGASYLFLLPWAARNALHFGRFIPFEDHAATRNFFAAALGIVENADGSYQDILARRLVPGWGGADQMDAMRAEALRLIGAAPFASLLSCLRRLVSMIGFHGPVILLAALGFFWRRRDPAVRGLALLCAYYILIQTPMVVSERYLKPALPCLLVLAGCAVAGLAGWRCSWCRPAEWAAAGDPVAPRRSWELALAVVAALLVPLYALGVQRLARETLLLKAPCALPAGGLTLLYCGEKQAAAGDPVAAHRSWERALAAVRRDPAPVSGLEVDILLRLVLADLSSGDSGAAQASLGLAVASDRHEVWKKALWLQDRSRLAEAVTLLRALADRYPDAAGYRTDLGIALALSGSPGESMAQFERAVASNPRDARARLNLGVLLDRAGRWREALEMYDRALDSGGSEPQWMSYALHIRLLRDELCARHGAAAAACKMP